MDSVRCNDLTLNTGASFYQESSSPPTYSGLIPSSGYFSAPSDVYFNGDFTITGLVYVLSTQYWARLIDFSTASSGVDNIVVTLSKDYTGQPRLVVFNNGNYGLLDSSKAIPTNTWTHIAAVLNGNNASLYLNCSMTDSTIESYTARNVVRSYNYIGKSNWGSDSLANARFRNVRIYNRGLSQSEIVADFYNTFSFNWFFQKIIKIKFFVQLFSFYNLSIIIYIHIG